MRPSSHVAREKAHEELLVDGELPREGERRRAERPRRLRFAPRERPRACAPRGRRRRGRRRYATGFCSRRAAPVRGELAQDLRRALLAHVRARAQLRRRARSELPSQRARARSRRRPARWLSSPFSASAAPASTVPPPSSVLGESARTTNASPGYVVVSRRRCRVAPTGAASAGGVSSNTSVPRIWPRAEIRADRRAAPQRRVRGFPEARRAAERAKAHAQRRVRKRTPWSASTAPRCSSDHLHAPGTFTATREPPDHRVARRAEHLQRAHAHVASRQIEPQRVAGAQRSLHQRSGDDRAAARQREHAVDRQKRGRVTRPRRQRDERIVNRGAQHLDALRR